jgi:hypothetical protein
MASRVWRFDGDEFFTKAVLAHVARMINDEAVHAIGFAR